MSPKKLIVLALIWATPALAAGVDAPELARAGSYGVGYRHFDLVQKDQPDLISPVVGDVPARHDRRLTIDLWYPASPKKGAKTVTYSTRLWGEPPKPPVSFTHRGGAIPDAKAAGQRHPLIILSHGYSNAPALMSWLTENLASKGYVVAGIRHADPNPYVVKPVVRAAPFYLRPSDISFAAAQLRVNLGQQIDPANVALIGYSQGGYGVLTAGGASLDPSHPLMNAVAGGTLQKVARGTAGAETIRVPGVKAIISMAPTGGGSPHIWGSGLAEITAPLMLIAGEADPVVGYDNAARTFFAETKHSDRYLLTFKQAGHGIALIPTPPAMQHDLWNADWFEDPIWRHDRLNAINLHFITAFLGLHLKGDASMRAYLDVPVEDSSKGTWDAPADAPWAAYSPGGPGVTLWKGFQRRHAEGLRLEHRSPD